MMIKDCRHTIKLSHNHTELTHLKYVKAKCYHQENNLQYLHMKKYSSGIASNTWVGIFT